MGNIKISSENLLKAGDKTLTIETINKLLKKTDYQKWIDKNKSIILEERERFLSLATYS